MQELLHKLESLFFLFLCWFILLVCLKSVCFHVPLKGSGLFIVFIIHKCRKERELASFNLLWSPDSVVSFPPQVQTVPSPCLPTPPSGAGRSTPTPGWPGLPTRPWWTRRSCGSSAATSSTPQTITWSKRKFSPPWASTLGFQAFGRDSHPRELRDTSPAVAMRPWGMCFWNTV